MQNTHKLTNIREIFSSIQGEGLYVGEKQIFVRFCTCNLTCAYCDTDFKIQNSTKYSSFSLYETLKNLNAKTISLTGGEPLCEVDFLEEFLKEYKQKLNKKIYLETNGTLYNELQKIIDFVDVVSMDIKLQSATGQINRFFDNEKFIQVALKNNKEIFIKVVFDENIKNDEISEISKIAKKYSLTIVLQPKMPMNDALDLETTFENFYKEYQNIRLIPQTHKFLNLL